MKAEELAHFEDGKLFLVYGEERRELGEVKDTEEQAIAYFKEKFEGFEAKVNEMLKDLSEDTNKGSYLGKIDSFMAQCGRLKALGDFGPVLTVLLNAKAEIEEIVKANRAKNTTLKMELLERVKKVIDAEDWLAGVEEIKEVRQAWIKTGKAEKEAALTVEFDDAVTAFYVEHKRLLSLKTELQGLRVEELERIITALRGYDASKGWDMYNELRDQWKKVEHVPAGVYKPLFDMYKDLCSKVDLGIKAVRKTQSKPKATQGKDAKAALLKELLKLKADYSKDLRPKLSDIKKR